MARSGRKQQAFADEILITDVERRLMRAFKTLRVLPDPERKFGSGRSAWPEVLQLREEAYGYTEVSMPRFRPTHFDVGDMLTALDWVRCLTKSDRKLVWWRSFDVSFKQIGLRLGRSDETARRRYRDVMIQIWIEANRLAALVRQNRNKVAELSTFRKTKSERGLNVW